MLDTLALIHDPNTLEACGISVPRGREILAAAEVLASQEWFQEELVCLNDFWSYLVELASARAWSQIQHAALWPQMLACVSHPNRDRTSEALQSMRRTWDAVLRAEDITIHAAGDLSQADRRALANVMADLAWNKLSFARECAVVCRQASWDPAHEDIQELCKSMWSKPLNTKYDLEDCFAHLAAVHKLSTKASQFNKWLVSFKFEPGI